MPHDPPDFAALTFDAIAALASQPPPPLDQWQPARTGDSAMRITADGRWFHADGEITRPAMIRAFARLLRREADGRHALVTPAEKQWIAVEDAALLAVELRADGSGRDARLVFRLNSDAILLAGPDHPLHVMSRPEGDIPYLAAHHGVMARLTRSCALDLYDHALVDDGGAPWVWSGGAAFALMPA